MVTLLENATSSRARGNTEGGMALGNSSTVSIGDHIRSGTAEFEDADFSSVDVPLHSGESTTFDLATDGEAEMLPIRVVFESLADQWLCERPSRRWRGTQRTRVS